MAGGGSTKGFVKNCDLVNIAILSTIAAGIGVYLIATAAIISKDGIFYIQQAQKISTDFWDVVKGHPFGYPYLIMASHNLVRLFTGTSSFFTWLYSAQGVTLFCRMAALAPLYYLGKLLVGRRDCFLALLILVMLPYPARFGSDVMREWPHLLFLAMGYLLLLLGGRQGKWFLFLGAGMLSGAGYLIRVECAQLVIYGLAWLAISVFYTRRNMSRPRLVLAAIALVGGFALTTGWCMWARGTVMTPKLNKLIESFSMDTSNALDQTIFCQDAQQQLIRAEFVLEDFVQGSVGYGLVKMGKRISENLLYYFTVPFVIGLYLQIRNRRFMEVSQFLMVAFILLNTAMVLMLYRCYGYTSRRHVLPLVVFMVFCIPGGLRVCAGWVDKVFPNRRSKSSGDDGRRFWFYLLLIVGLCICVPKLVTPLRSDKKSYRTVSKWLSENTRQDDVVVVFDPEVAFYAQRKYVLTSKLWKHAGATDYLVERYEDADKISPPVMKGKILGERFSVDYPKRDKTARLVVYKVNEDPTGTDVRPELTVSKSAYGAGEAITVDFRNASKNAQDWIGLYEAGAANHKFIYWLRTDGTRTGTAGLTKGSVTFPDGLPDTGQYEARLFFDNSYDLEAGTVFKVE